jgi:putative hydrolase of the HAD superfamily
MQSVVTAASAALTTRRISAVLFDLGGTLDAVGVPWKERLFELYRSEGLAMSAREFAPLFYRVDDALVGAIPVTLSLRETVERLVDGVSAGLGVDAARTGRIATRFLACATECARTSADLLEQLARRYRLGVVSNFYGNLETVCGDLGLRPYLRVMVDSTAVGCTKPDARIFHHALEELGAEAHDAVFVGDSPGRDMAGARDVGMEHVWLVGDAASNPVPCCPTDRIIRSLGELKPLLL